MGRRRTEKVVQWKVYVPVDVAWKTGSHLIETHQALEGENFRKRLYGHRSHLITTLLEDWLKEQANAQRP
jgi:hypothetical protein